MADFIQESETLRLFISTYDPRFEQQSKEFERQANDQSFLITTKIEQKYIISLSYF